ncbi:MAG: acyl-ACP--UDP-N-acetylglucosamine O-acyltransferase [Planctomycetota bacterium]
MAEVHPTAVVEDGAALHESAVIGPLCHVGPSVTIGAGTRLRSHVVVTGRTTLGEGNDVWPFSVLGGDPQDLKYKGEDSELIVGDHNSIRESVSIHKGTANDQNLTRVGSNNLIMAYVHVGHDSLIGDHVVIANSVAIPGHMKLDDHAVVGGMTGFHEFVTVGRYAYVGGGARITRDVPPFMKVDGAGTVRLFNDVGLKRHKFDSAVAASIRDAWKRLYKRNGEEHGVMARGEVLGELLAEYPDNWAIQELVAAIKRSRAGIHGRYRETLRRDNAFTNPVK